MAVDLPRSECGWFEECSISTVTDVDEMLWNGRKRLGNIRSECEEDEGT